MRQLLATASVLLLMLIPTSPAGAQSTDAGPALGVARISLINGDVTTKRGDSGDWVAAQINEPVIEGDIVETGPGSRMELQLDYSNIIRLDGSTTVEVTELADRRFRVRLLEGRLTYSELKNGEADIDIETPVAAIRPRERGRYEVTVQGPETIVVVHRGMTEIASINGIETLDKGRMMVIRDSGAGPEFRVERARGSDDWDDWNRSRDDRLSDVQSYRYVSQDIVGAADLDDHGSWTYVSGYGHCWYPRGVSVGWSPYRRGRWAWTSYYGWNWVGYEPWGWAPYHYGRWFHTPGRGWGWWPGYRHHRQFYRPALVSFFGFGGGRGFSVGVGIGFGNVGWVPLAPGELYRPWYGRGGFGGGRRGNQTIIVDNSVNIYNNYRNARVNNGVTVVDANGFSRGQVNNPRSLRGQELQRASLIRGQIPVAPARESQGRIVRASARGSNSAAARAASVRTYSRPGATTTRSNRLQRTSFDQQRQQVVSSVRSFRTQQDANGGSVRSTNSTTRGSLSGAQSPNRSTSRTIVRGGAAGTTSVSRTQRATGTRSSTVRSGSQATTRSNSGWRSLGDGASTVGRTNRTTGTSTVRSGSRSSTAPTRSTSRVNRSTTNRSSSQSRVNRAPSSSRSTSRSQATIPQRSSSRVRSNSTSRSSGSSRVNRAPSSSRSTSRSRATIPQRSSSRVRNNSSSRSSGSSRINRAPSSSRSTSRSRATIPQRRSSSRVTGASRSSGSSRINRAPSSSRSRMSTPQRAPSRAPRASGPSRSSAPKVRSAPSRSSGGSVRSAPRSSRSSGRKR